MYKKEELETKKAVEEQELTVTYNYCGHKFDSLLREWGLQRDSINGQPIPLRYSPNCLVCDSMDTWYRMSDVEFAAMCEKLRIGEGANASLSKS